MCETESSSTTQDGLGVGLAGEMFSLGDYAVDYHCGQLGDAGRKQDVTGVGVGGDERAPQPGA